MRRLAYAALVLGPLACGITYSPAEFLTPTDSTAAPPVTEAGASLPDAIAPDATTPADEDDAGAAGIRIVLVGGHRDLLVGESGLANVAETMVSTFSTSGELGPWTFDAPPPVPAQWTHARIAGGSLFVHNATTLVRAPFTDRVTGAWSTATIKPAFPGLKPWLLDERGLLSGAPQLSTKSFGMPFVDGGLGDWVEKPATMAVERVEVTLARAGNFVYAFGGRKSVPSPSTPSTTADANVEVAKIDANGELENFAALTKLSAGDAGAEHPVYAPVVATSATHVVVLGGAAEVNGTPSNVALAARITDPATGALGPFTPLPSLPMPLTAFAAIVTVNHILVFGGLIGTKTTDAVLDLTIQFDGSYGTAWKQIGTLPGARSGLVAVTY